METKSWLFQKRSKMEKPIDRVIKEKKQRKEKEKFKINISNF